MHRAPRLLLAFLLGTGVITVHPSSRLMASSEDGPRSEKPAAQQSILKTAAAKSPDIPFGETEVQAEQDLLQLANQSRKRAGVGPLMIDSGLSQAARVHAMAMLEARQLSHQFYGEPALPQRLAVMTSLQLDQEGENVALDYDAEHGHEHLMLSPPHRANLLNAAYNVIGLGVVRSGDRWYIVQDFAHAVTSYSPDEVKDRVATAVTEMRRRSRMRGLPRHDVPEADEYACSMAHADKLGTAPVQKLAKQFTVLTYTSLHPETLPDGTSHAITSRNLRSFSVGACYARSETYPTGVYWIVLTLD
jgi:uncharacterized protein YkwD